VTGIFHKRGHTDVRRHTQRRRYGWGRACHPGVQKPTTYKWFRKGIASKRTGESVKGEPKEWEKESTAEKGTGFYQKKTALENIIDGTHTKKQAKKEAQQFW